MKDDRYLELKAELLVEGVKATPDALKQVGRTYKEQNHGLFGWDFEDHVEMVLPDDFTLPDGTVVQFRKNSRSASKKTDWSCAMAKRTLAKSDGYPDRPTMRRRPPMTTPWSRSDRSAARTVSSSVTRTTAATSRSTKNASSVIWSQLQT